MVFLIVTSNILHHQVSYFKFQSLERNQNARSGSTSRPNQRKNKECNAIIVYIHYDRGGLEYQVTLR